MSCERKSVLICEQWVCGADKQLKICDVVPWRQRHAVTQQHSFNHDTCIPLQDQGTALLKLPASFLTWGTGRSKRNGKASRYRNNTNPYEKNMKENWGPIVVRIQFMVIKGRTIWASRMSSVGNLLGLTSIETFSEFITISNWPLLILGIKGTIIGNRRNTRADRTYYPSYKHYVLQVKKGRLKRSWTPTRIHPQHCGNCYVIAFCYKQFTFRLQDYFSLVTYRFLIRDMAALLRYINK